MSTRSDRLQEWFASRSKNDWRALFVCILISASIWVLRSLTEDAIDVFTVPVVFVDTPDGFDLVSSPAAELDLEVTSTGFGILGQRYFKREKPLEFSLSSLPRIEGEQAIPSKILFNRARKLVGSDRDILSIQPDSMYVTLSKRAQKEMRIIHLIEENLDDGQFISKQSDNLGGKVIVTGPQSLLDSLSSVTTSKLVLEESGVYDMELLIPLGLKSSSAEQFKLTVALDVLSKRSFTVPITLSESNKARNIVLYPSEITLTIIGGNEVLNSFTSELFSVVLASNDLETLAAAGQNKVAVKLQQEIEGMKSIEIAPGRVEFHMPR